MRETIKFEYVDDEGGEAEAELPGRYEVCPRCQGRGTHTNPSIDGNGITSSEMEELDYEFQEDYINGVYDVPCYQCDGARVVLQVDRNVCCTDEQINLLKRYDEKLRDDAQYRAECRAEMVAEYGPEWRRY